MKFLLSRSILLVAFLITIILIVGYARGYRINLSQKKLISTGILVASSSPDGAKIYINGKLEGATNSNIGLSPGIYNVEIKKDGYSTWKKTIVIKGELVLKADALLFPQNPSLSPITSLGVVKAQFFPISSRTLILSDRREALVPITTQAEEVLKDGLYLLDNSKKPLNIFSPLKLVAPRDTTLQNLDFSQSSFAMSPDGKQILMNSVTTGKQKRSLLISADEVTTSVFDVTGSIATIQTAWEKEDLRNTQKILETFKEPFARIASDSFKIAAFSPDETKILYMATKTVTLPPIITPPLIATNQTDETRTIAPGSLYVYDKKEDKNYKLDLPTTPYPLPHILWFPDSAHLIIKERDHIDLIDYDGINRQVVYSGPFEKDFLGATPDGKLLILANLNPQKNQLPDIYAVGIR